MEARDSGFESAVERARSIMGSLASTAASVASIAAGVLAAGVGIATVGVVAMANEAGEAEENLFRLGKVLDATGNSAGFSIGTLQSWAAEIQRTTQFSDDAALSMFRVVAGFRNIKGDVFTDTAKAAMDFAVVMGTDLPAAAETLASAINNPIRGMQTLARSGVVLTDAQRAMVEELVASNRVMEAQKILLGAINATIGGASAGALDTYRGAWANVGNQIGEVVETIGAAFIPTLKDLAGWITAQMPTIQAWATALSTSIQSIAGEWIPWMIGKVEGMATSIGEAVAVTKAVWDNFDLAVAAVAKDWAANLSEMWDRANWFADNFVAGPIITVIDNIKSMAGAVQQMFLNLVDNVKSLFGAMWEFITSGGETWSLSMKDILEDVSMEFRSIEPAKAFDTSDATKELRKSADELGGALGERINAEVAKVAGVIKSIFHPQDAAGPAPSPLPDSAFQPPTGQDVKDGSDERAGAHKQNADQAQIAAQMMGIVEAINRMQTAAASQETPWERYMRQAADEQAKEAKDSKNIQREVAANTKQVADALSHGIVAVAA